MYRRFFVILLVFLLVSPSQQNGLHDDCVLLINTVGKRLWDFSREGFTKWAKGKIKKFEELHHPCTSEIAKCLRKQLGNNSTYVITADGCCNDCSNN
ncbi:unnamed protein product [Bursaphelenchus xylophilus]|uniref:(pine wood nematode) hypothetical protein n=1 Tax=Bursaphelenchus xylophilus TaxID=6326 RepID=A0A1I7SX43_BURXY|nr:unnamed protein product [Bursaphelenchus xylophilus]CAG9100160.1 unnamed protein product [Bursaphelenchus xylophilus]